MAGVVIQIVMGSLLTLASVILVATSESLENAPPFGFFVAVALTGALLILFAVLMLLGYNWARITGTVILAIIALGTVGGPSNSPLLILSALIIVFSWLPSSNRWYRALRASGKRDPTPPSPGFD